MANQIKKKFIGAGQVGSAQILIEKDLALKGTLQDNSEVDLIKLNTSDEVLLKGIKVLDSAGLIPSAILPSYVDDVLEYANLAAFPVTGETGKIYVAIDTSKQYRWSGSVYVQITSGAVDSVNGQTGIVVLDTDDIAEGATNKYYSETLFDSSFGGKTTDDLGEGVTNKYYSETLFDASLGGKTTDDIAEGLTNLYFTEARAKTAAVSDAIADGVIDVAPSQNAVFDALALKQANLVADKYKHTIVAGDLTAGYIDLPHQVFFASLFVDRLAIHEGAAEDYTLSVVGGVTRVTFLNDLVTPGQNALIAGDNIYVKYLKLA